MVCIMTPTSIAAVSRISSTTAIASSFESQSTVSFMGSAS